MKVLVLNGSPKLKSDTMRLTSSFLKGINENNEHEIEIIDVIKKKINPCLGCFKCWENLDGKCIQKDDQNYILERMVDVDIIILSFPLYCYSMPSHLKAVIDRIIPLSKMSMKEVNGVVVHDTLLDFSKKRFVAISGCGFPNWEGNFDALKLQMKNLFRFNLTTICVPETPMLNVEEAKPSTDPLLEKFVQAGRIYNKNLSLNEEVALLETPMLPNEVYINIVNGQK